MSQSTSHSMTDASEQVDAVECYAGLALLRLQGVHQLPITVKHAKFA